MFVFNCLFDCKYAYSMSIIAKSIIAQDHFSQSLFLYTFGSS